MATFMMRRDCEAFAEYFEVTFLALMLVAICHGGQEGFKVLYKPRSNGAYTERCKKSMKLND
jgi:hypothetical protein